MRDSKKARDIHAEAMDRFRRITDAYYQERRQCLEDRRFYAIPGGQWEGALEEQFENKPRFEMNKVHLSIIKIFNEYRNNRVTVDFVSKDGTENSELADTCDGLFRADEQDSVAEEAYDNAFEEAVGGGFGAVRLVSEYEDEEDDENENQRIRIEPIYDADSSVFFDMDAKRQDKADAKFAFVMYSMTPEEFEDEYDKSPASMTKEIEYTEYDWYTPDLVYIAEYYRVEMKRETVHIYQDLMGNEERYTDRDFEDDPDLLMTLEATGKQKIREKKVKRKKVRKYIVSGNEILEDCGYIAGKNIPIIPFYGKRWFVDSVERCMGHVRLAKDAQRLKNMLTSKLAEISSLSAVEKPILTPEQISGYEQMWADDNIKNFAYLLINPTTDAAGSIVNAGPTAYTKPPSIPPALAALMQIVDVDMKELLGNYNEGEKMLSHVSGKAQEMIQKRIDGQAFIYMSNFAKGIHRIGEVWLCMAREIYVEKGRKMKTIDTMGQTGTAELYAPGLNEQGAVVEKNDITKATFDVAVSVGPTSVSQREATVRSVTGMLQITDDPEMKRMLQFLALMNMEGDGVNEAQDYIRQNLVQMGVLKPTPEEQKAMEEAAANAQPSPVEQLQISMAKKEEAEAQKKTAEVAETQADTQKTVVETQKIIHDMRTERNQELSDARNNTIRLTPNTSAVDKY